MRESLRACGARAATFASAAVLVLVVSVPARAATVNVVYDNPGDGFDSNAAPDPVSPAPGATLGAQRRAAFEAAATDWGGRLTSNVPIEIGAEMVPLTCSSFQGVLGAAGTNFVEADWSAGPGGSAPPFADTWYPSALASKIAGQSLAPGSDIGATFNSALDNNDGCLTGIDWYYALGPGGNPPGTISFYDVVLHEIGHGVGVQTFVDTLSGSRFLGMDDVYMRHLEDHSLGLTWNQMTDQQRRNSATDDRDLHWIGAAVQAAAGILDTGADGTHVRMYAPASLSPGSSVSHFDTTLGAGPDDELMEPFATGDEAILLTDELLEDEGWGPVLGGLLCGNSVLDGSEECDDGGQVDGDGCNSVCRVEQCHACVGEPSTCTPETGTACDDGEQCTSDVCDAGSCVSTPLTGDPCEDGISCTTDTCNAGVCVGDTSSCELDHFKMYKVKKRRGGPVFRGATVDLTDQFEARISDAIKAQYLGNPADKNAEGVSVPEVRMVCYKIRDSKSQPGQPSFTPRTVETVNPFGTERLLVTKPTGLCVPSSKGEQLLPAPLPFRVVDHFKCYKAKTAKGWPKFARLSIGLDDEFESKQTAVLAPVELCNPVDEDGQGILDPSAHLECYKIVDDNAVPGQAKFARTDRFTTNEFGSEGLVAVKPRRLCVPSTKTEL